jgi:hypothetical protein
MQFRDYLLPFLAALCEATGQGNITVTNLEISGNVLNPDHCFVWRMATDHALKLKSATVSPDTLLRKAWRPVRSSARMTIYFVQFANWNIQLRKCSSAWRAISFALIAMREWQVLYSHKSVFAYYGFQAK